MPETGNFLSILRAGGVCLGAGISFTDPTVTEALSSVVDFLWIDMEHSPLSIEAVQAHVMAAKGSRATPLVRVAWNDPVLIKTVLDVGAAGIIIPMVRTADEARRAVAACKYPPEGIRGFGPRRPTDYGRRGGPEYCRAANADVIVIPQIEHIDAVRNLDEIIKVPGITSLLIGPQDLAGSMGHMGEPQHPEVWAAIDTIIEKARRAKMFVGAGTGGDPAKLAE